MDWATLATVAATLTVAAAGYWNALRLQDRRERLARASRQLSELYGPLRALSAASERAFLAYRQKELLHDDPDPAVWRAWVQRVFMPLNDRMLDAVVAGGDLIDDPEMPECFLELVSHVTAFRAVVGQWEAGDFSEHTSAIAFPPTLRPHVDERFDMLKAEQASLLGKGSMRRRRSAKDERRVS